MDLERELKYSTTEEHVPSQAELTAAIADTGLTVDPPEVARYVDVYYDDEAGRLRAAGVALRRRYRPSGTYATFKGAASRDGDLHSRPELELPVGEDDGWPEEVLAALPGPVGPDLLAPLAELWVQRVRTVARAGGAPVAELAFDAVECRAPGQDASSVTFNEVEIEALVDGEAALGSMRALAEAVDTLVPLTPSSSSKLERALALLAVFG